MSVIYSLGNVRWPDPHDASDKKYYTLHYRPADRSSSTPYRAEIDTVKPTVANGCIYECSSGGISASTEPTWGTVEEGITVDGGVEWVCKPDACLLQNGDTITVSTWTGTGCTIDNASIVGGISTKCRLTAVPAVASSVTLTNHITITRANSDVEERDRSLIINIKDM